MFGFGDEQVPRADSVRLVEEMVLDYITSVVAKVRFFGSTFARTLVVGCRCRA